MKNVNPFKTLLLFTITILLVACGETETNLIKWHDQQAGIKAWEKNTLNGIITITHYYANGMKMKEEEFDGLKRHGKSTKWYENGVVESVKTFEHGQKVGAHKRFYNNGQISIQKHFKSGEKNGVWTYYLNNGEQWRIETYDSGSLASAEIFKM